MTVSPEERKELLDEAVADVLREGGRIESEAGFTAVVSKRNRMRAGEHVAMAIGTILLFLLFWPLGFIAGGFWTWAGTTRKVRYSLSIDADGELEQTVLGR